MPPGDGQMGGKQVVSAPCSPQGLPPSALLGITGLSMESRKGLWVLENPQEFGARSNDPVYSGAQAVPFSPSQTELLCLHGVGCPAAALTACICE